MSDFFRLEDDAPARRIVYIGALLLIAVPFVQAGSQLWPLKLANIQWRFGAANALSAVLLLPFLGGSLMFLTARATSSRGISRAVGAFSALMALAVAGSTIAFVFDALQLRTIVQSRMMEQFNTTAFRVTILSAIFAVAYLLLALACFRQPAFRAAPARTGGPSAGNTAARKQEEQVTLIVGQGSSKTE